LGLPAIDRLLPQGGLAAARVHEVLGQGGEPDGAALGFLLRLVARLMCRVPGPVIWCGRALDLHGPGLALLGLDTRRLVLVRAGEMADILWAMEGGLRSPGLAGVVAELPRPVDLTQCRRLQLAAEAGGATGFILRGPASTETDQAGGVETRWRIGSCL